MKNISLCFKLLMSLTFLFLSFTPHLFAQSIRQEEYLEIEWEDLIPASWQPEQLFNDINIDDYEDDAPELEGLLEKLKQEWDKAPANEAIDGEMIKIPGFIAPIDWDGQGALHAFLLVPYFGACIHSPPPPANQIIFIELTRPIKGFNSMDAVWIYGQLHIEKNNPNEMGSSTYTMDMHKITPYP